MTRFFDKRIKFLALDAKTYILLGYNDLSQTNKTFGQGVSVPALFLFKPDKGILRLYDKMDGAYSSESRIAEQADLTIDWLLMNFNDSYKGAKFRLNDLQK